MGPEGQGLCPGHEEQKQQESALNPSQTASPGSLSLQRLPGLSSFAAELRPPPHCSLHFLTSPLEPVLGNSSYHLTFLLHTRGRVVFYPAPSVPCLVSFPGTLDQVSSSWPSPISGRPVPPECTPPHPQGRPGQTLAASSLTGFPALPSSPVLCASNHSSSDVLSTKSNPLNLSPHV